MNFMSQTRGDVSILTKYGESQAALDQHMATPHFKRLEQTGRELVREPFEVNIVKGIQTGAAAA
jgi:quinol monooxygenase YgiN